jgi:hypothetical protein
MKKLLLGVTAAVAFSIAGFVAAQTTTTQSVAQSTEDATATATQPDPGTKMRLATMDTSAAAFRKMDADNDGRISALEAAENPRVVAAFTLADKDKDGYLSREEFEAMSASSTARREADASTPSGDHVTDPSGDEPATAPNEPSPTSDSPSPRTIRHPGKRP